MSAIVIVFDMPGMTSEKYDKVMEDLKAAGAGSPKGRLHHVASSKPGGWLIVDVWESAELLDRFRQTLTPIMQKNGVIPVQPQVYPIHSIVKG
jgi:hypothetical protein